MTNFWNDLPKPFFILAPMEAVTDVVFRHVIAHAARPDVFFTEFTNASSYMNPRGNQSTRGRLAFTDDEQPMVGHIWGHNPEEFEFMAKGLKELGFSGIDINTGCPVKDVVKQGSGAGLIGHTELMGQLIAAAKTAGLPVSVKARLGSNRIEEWREWLGFLLQQDLANLTIHLRTRKEMSKVDAHFELIPEIKKLRDEIAPGTLLTINGDIRDRQHGLELVEKYGVDGVMIGRGVFTNPFAFAKEYPSRLNTIGRNNPQPKIFKVSKSSENPGERSVSDDSVQKGELEIDAKKDQLIELLHYHLDLHDKYEQELGPRKFDPLKRFFKIYIRDFPGASELREQLMHAKTTAEVRSLLSKQ